MKARVLRWALRLWGALNLAFAAFFTLLLIAATLFSNMDRWWAGSICAVILAAFAWSEGMIWRTYFVGDAQSDSTETADEDAAEPEPEIIVKAPMTDAAATISREALASLTGAISDKAVWL
jgi:hypothetical protein